MRTLFGSWAIVVILGSAGCSSTTVEQQDQEAVPELVPLRVGNTWTMQRTGWIRTNHQNESFDWVESWIIDRDTLVAGETWYSILQVANDGSAQFTWRSGWHTNRPDGLWRFDHSAHAHEAQLWIPVISQEGQVISTAPGVDFLLIGVTDRGRSRIYRRTTSRLAAVDIVLPEPQVDVFRISEEEGFVRLSDFSFASDNDGPWHKTLQHEWNLIRFQPGNSLGTVQH